MNIKKTLPILGLVLTLAACQDLAVDNLNSPDRDRALAEPSDIAGLVGSSLLTWYWGAHDFGPGMGQLVLADEGSSSWGNVAMQELSSEPRAAWNNGPGYNYRGHNQSPWYDMYEAISNVNDALVAIQTDDVQEALSAEELARIEAFGKFVQAMSHAYLAGFYDQAFIFTEDLDLESTEFALQPYGDVMTAALGMFDEAIAVAQAGTFSVPEFWVGNIPGWDQDDLAELASGFKAIFRAGVARTPADRAAVDWTAVMAEAAAGRDWPVEADWDNWWEFTKNYSHRFDWMRADMKLVGPGDNSGGYETWLATPVADRVNYEMTTNDLRIIDPANDCSDVPSNYGVTVCGTYFYERPTQNFRPERGTYHYSSYGFNRFMEYRQTWLGSIPVMVDAHLDMLRAEGLMRTGGDRGTVATLINTTRVANGGLTALDGTETDDELWAALMYEKRIETATIGHGLQWYDMRGWGYMPAGSILQFPIPARELETLLMDIYTFGGNAGEPGSATGTGCIVNGPTGDCEGMPRVIQ